MFYFSIELRTEFVLSHGLHVMTEPPFAPNFLDTPTLDKCPKKALDGTTINDIENTIINNSRNSRHNYWTRNNQNVCKRTTLSNKKLSHRNW